jgi:hypothetical protein
MQTEAKGTFAVKMTPQAWAIPSDEQNPADPNLASFALSKTFDGDLKATSQAIMLSAGTSEKGSAGYVAIEKVMGILQGRKGSFVLQHSGTMNRGTPELKITVVPDSGTDELTGLGGEMAIKIDNGQHLYEFSYTMTTIQ